MIKISWLQSNNTFKKVEGDFSTVDTVPVGVYNIGLNISGWYLEKYADKFTFNYKLYGLQTEFCEHVLKTYKNTNKDLPILIMSGNDDPVGNFKTGILKIDKLYKKAKFNNVKLKVYNGMRHNLLDEPERIIAINDIILFINTNNLKVDR